MDADFPPLKTWEFFLFARKSLGITFLQKLFQRGHSEIYRWSRDPEFTGDSKRNPLDRLRILVREMVNQGYDREARAGVAMLAEEVGCSLADIDAVKPDKSNILEECLDDHPPLARFHEAIQQKRSRNEVRHLWQEARRELDETWHLFDAHPPDEE